MLKIERQFEYRSPDAGALKLLGVLMIIMSPLAFWMTLQQTSDISNSTWLVGTGWYFLPPAMVPWIVRALAVVLLWAGFLIIQGAGKQKKFGGRVAFTSTGMIWEAGPPDGSDNEIKYEDISNVQMSEKKRQKIVTFKRAGVGNCFITSTNMRSLSDFDEMASLLMKRTEGKSAYENGK